MRVTIEDLPDEVYQRLQAEATLQRRTLQDQIVMELIEAADRARIRENLRNSREALERFVASLPPVESNVPLLRGDTAKP